MLIKDYPEDARPYEKFELCGPTGLTDGELLAILIRTGTKEQSALDLAYTLLQQENELNTSKLLRLFNHTMESLQQIKGIGRVKAIQILALVELSKRLSEQKYTKSEPLTQPSKIVELFMERMRHEQEEQFITVYLDTKCKLIQYEIVSKGSLTASIVHPREVYKGAINKSAHSIIVLHNHPSGDPTPSKEDIAITKRLEETGKIIGIGLLDHIVIGDRCYISLKEQGYL